MQPKQLPGYNYAPQIYDPVSFFANLEAQRKAQLALQQAPKPPPKRGFIENLARDFVHPFSTFADTTIGNPVRELTAELTGNEKAYQNAYKRSNKTLGLGEKGTDLTSALKQLAGNTTQVGLTLLAPEAKTFKAGAAVGAGFGAGGALSHNASLEDTLKQAAFGAGIGGVAGKISGALSKGASKGATPAILGPDDFTKKTGWQAYQQSLDAIKSYPPEVRNSLINKFNQDAASEGILKSIPQVATAPEMSLAKAAKLTAGPNAPSRTGRQLVRNTLGIDDIVTPGKAKPNTLFKADEMLNEAFRSDLKGSPAAMLRQVNKQQEILGGQVQGVLAKSNKTVPASSIVDQAKKEVLSKLPLPTKEFPVRAEVLRSLSPLGNGEVNAQALYNFKNSLDVESAFRKIANGSTLTAKETADLALWKQADNWLAKLAPEAKELTQRQSNLYGLAQGLTRMTLTRGEPGGATQIAVRAVQRPFRATENAIGRGLNKVGSAEANLGNLIPEGARGSLATALQQTAYRVPGALSRGGGQPAQPSALGAQQDAIVGANPYGQQLTPQPIQPRQQSIYPLEAFLSDVQRDPKNYNTYAAIYKTVADANKASQPKLTAAQQKTIDSLNSVSGIADQIESEFMQAGGGGGIKGFGTQVATRIPGLASNAKAYEATRKASIGPLARAISGEVGVLTDKDIARAEGLLPKLSDTQYEAQLKLQNLRRTIEARQAQFQSYAPASDLTSALSQLQGGF